MRPNQGWVNTRNRLGLGVCQYWMVSSRAGPQPPVRFTIMRIFLRSMTGRISSGLALFTMVGVFTSVSTQVRCVWTSMTGYRERGTMVSRTCSILLGWKSVIATGGSRRARGQPRPGLRAIAFE